jgi:hypothetical protein
MSKDCKSGTCGLAKSTSMVSIASLHLVWGLLLPVQNTVTTVDENENHNLPPNACELYAMEAEAFRHACAILSPFACLAWSEKYTKFASSSRLYTFSLATLPSSTLSISTVAGCGSPRNCKQGVNHKISVALDNTSEVEPTICRAAKIEKRLRLLRCQGLITSGAAEAAAKCHSLILLSTRRKLSVMWDQMRLRWALDCLERERKLHLHRPRK